MYVAVTGGEIILTDHDRENLERRIDKMCSFAPDLFCKEYITIMSAREYREEFLGS